MPKRNREDGVKTPAPLSALAARRLHSQDAAALKTPETKRKSPKISTSRSRSPVTATSSESESAEDIVAKRREIERKLREQVKVQARARQTLQYGNTSLEESALARVRRRKSGEAGDLAPVMDEEMVDVNEVVELGSGDEAIGVEDEAAESPVDLGNGEVIPRSKLMQISTFVPTESNHTQNSDNTTTFRMVTGETLVILGEYRLQIMKGAVTLAGATLTKSSGLQVVYAPSTHSLPVIECVAGNGENKGGEFDAEVTITSQDSNSGLRDVGKLCPMFNSIWTLSKHSGEGAAFLPLYSTTYNVSTLSIPLPWESCIETLINRTDTPPTSFPSTGPPVIVITGSKGNGKSTFARILVNKLLTSPSSKYSSVAYLDVDPGQPEFSPPGFISLHKLTSPILGPPFTHPNPSTVLRSHHTGFTSPREDPTHYISCIINLITHYRELLASATTAEDTTTPLIINTTGWTKGLGLELLSDIILQSQASDIIFLSGALERTNPVSDVVPDGVRLHELRSASSAPARFSAADLRMLMTMSYLHHDPAKGKWDFVTPLTAVPPWVVGYTGPEPGVDAVTVLGEQVVPEELVTAVEGTLVGVVVVDDDLAGLGTLVHTPGAGIPYLIDAPPLSPETSFAAGLALVRGVDAERGCLQVITSIREEEMERWDREGLKVVLVRGRLELAVWEMVGAGVEAPWVSVGAVAGADGKGAGVWRVRRNVMRRGQQVGGA